MFLSKMTLSLIIMASMLSISACKEAPKTQSPDQNQEQNTANRFAITVYHSPTCGCCSKWIDHLKENNFKINSIETTDMEAIKKKYAIPDSLGSCHTGVIGDYFIEGHVPAKDIKRLLKDKPENIAGLSVPQMPIGTPGMEMGEQKDDFSVFAFSKTGQSHVFKRYTYSEKQG